MLRRAALLAALLGVAADAPDWPMDVLHLRNGKRLTGLVVRETERHVQFQNVRRRPGRPTVVIASTFDRAEVARVERIGDDDRRRLVARLAELDPTGEREQEKMGRIELHPAVWGSKPGAGWRYDSDYFTLTSGASETIVRRAAVRLEEFFAAFTDLLPPRHAGGGPTSVVLVPSVEEYRSMVRAEGRAFLNPAFYDPSANRIVCASDLKRLGDDLEPLRRKHKQMLAEGVKAEAELRKRFRPGDLPRFLQPILDERRLIRAADEANQKALDRAMESLLRAMAHEAFHAYLASFVYPPAEGGLPRWLNEGLAQVVETAFLEAGELRVGHADGDRLDRCRDLLRRGQLLPLADLLTDDPKRFLVTHAGDRFGSDRAYLTCWALAFHLTFERRLVGTPAFERYVKDLAAGTPPVRAFETLVGRDLAGFEGDFRRWLTLLQPDGTTAEVLSGRRGE
jgi:hypothetical protein